MNTAIISEDVQAYIIAHEGADVATIALKKSPFANVTARELAEQIDGRQRAKRKIPEWTATPGIIFPEKLNLEQCSSSLTGQFKAALIRPNSRLIDLTGGFGVDSYYFARHAKHVVHCEHNAKLSAIVAHNFNVFGFAHVSCHAGDGTALLAQSPDSFDYIYTDPSRRVAKQKVFRLEDCEPNVMALQNLFFTKAPCIITKLAPLLDIHLARQQLKNVRAVYVISIDNDCKELLFVQDKAYEGEPSIHAVRMRNDGETQLLTFTYSEEQEVESHYATPSGYLYDPDVAITKAGAFKTVGHRFGLSKLSQHSHLYSSSAHIPDFPGRIFRIDKLLPLAVYKKNKENQKANVIAKNFPLRVDDIRKKYKIPDGGSRFLFFTSLSNGDLVVIDATRIS
ncbi:hypothetical protein PQ465_11865 [Sphingobacterium oryzagri]|uniref:THUMP-like domain-containing protein n=1 Tax=Sphingobacterium oryzagri TaxID=3025669 RepID=A0ABY7WEW6_9SPHI|nr:hypothetical protein [Sphingobacterium sp. KACC 22765]WDF67002.1 hypothetical protein PQ465_11865 [Sphingobacterium sp. KACC 22765]